MSPSTFLRQEVFLRLSLKALRTPPAPGQPSDETTGFTNYNDFTLLESWLPYQDLPKLVQDHPQGLVYVITGTPGDVLNNSRANNGIVQQHAVMVGYQAAITRRDDVDEIDMRSEFVEELTTVLRKEVDPDLFSFSRLEYLKDEDTGIPFNFYGARDGSTFESYLTAYYNYVLTYVPTR